MSPRTAKQLRGAVPVVVTFVLVSLIWDFVTSVLYPQSEGAKPAAAIFIGVLIAFPLIIFESSSLTSGRERCIC